MLNSCAPRVVVVNIDSGFGAAAHVARIARAIGFVHTGITKSSIGHCP